MEDNVMKFYNVSEDSYPLWELCRQNGWTKSSYEEWEQNDGALSFYEGDPDMIKVDGEVGYFCKCGGSVYYYADAEAEPILRAFFKAFETGVTIGGESYARGENPEGVRTLEKTKEKGLWQQWEELRTGIAFRGGAGYCYWITDWSDFKTEENENN